MLAVAREGGRIRPRVAVVKSLASALCIGSGGSVGREGPIVQIGSALGSTVGQLARLPRARPRLLVACGAAGGISATFNAPIAGVFFALEVILRDFETESFGVVVLSSVTATAIGAGRLRLRSFLPLPRFHARLAGANTCSTPLLGVARRRWSASRSSASSTDARTWPTALARPSVAAARRSAASCSALLLLLLPQMYGVGYPVLEAAVDGHYVVAFLLRAAGRQAPGDQPDDGDRRLRRRVRAVAVHGRDARRRASDRRPRAAARGDRDPGRLRLVGMGAVFAGAARAPITAVLIVFELTGDYAIILPLMLAVVIATALSRAAQRGHDLHAEASPSRDRSRCPTRHRADAARNGGGGHARGAGRAGGRPAA